MQLPNKATGRWYTAAALFGAFLLYGGYFLERHNTFELLGIFSALFSLCLYLIWQRQAVSIRTHFTAGFIFRIILLFMLPNLSDDLYRFVWDGQLTWQGIHPFSQVPSWYMEQGILPDGLSVSLYNNLNSPDYFTVYPPVSQFFFMLTAAVTGGDVFWSAVLLRTILIAAECGTFFLLQRFILQAGLDPRRISWYWLNPLVILEITGNLHFEGLMIFFCLLSILLLYSRHIWMAGGVFGLAIGVKLIPLIFLPVMLKQTGVRVFARFALTTFLLVVAFTLPFLDADLVYGLGNSLELYFRKFEFNASIYYIVREIGWWYKGYNIIGTAGPYLAFFTVAAIVVFAWKHSPVKIMLTSAIGISLTIFLLLATTVHPWYILILLALMPLQKVYYPVLWSGLIVLSYAGYSVGGFEENLWLTFVEYALVVVYMLYEFLYAKKLSFNPLYGNFKN